MWDILGHFGTFSTDFRARRLSEAPLPLPPFQRPLLMLCLDEADHRWHWRVHYRIAGDELRVCDDTEGGIESEARRVVNDHPRFDDDESATARNDHPGSDNDGSATPDERDHGATHHDDHDRRRRGGCFGQQLYEPVVLHQRCSGIGQH